MITTNHDPLQLRENLQQLGLWGLLENLEDIAQEPWLPRVIEMETVARHQRSREKRLTNAKLGSFKPAADFDWSWPKKIDREAFDELFRLKFVAHGVNVILLGPNGIGKTMLAKNLVYQSVIRGHTARFTTASDMLSDLAAQETNASLSRRLRRYCQPRVLGIDEVGYLSYDARYADLLFEVVTRRYNDGKPIILTTNKPFAQWTEVFPNAGCVVTLVDRLIHRSEILTIEGKSYRLREAQERTKQRQEQRRKKTSSKGTSGKSP
jgi:DNA replication protein DnaC